MANDFSQDSRIIEFWRFENDLTAGKASNDLTGSGTPTYNSAAPLEGAYSLDLESTSSQYAYRTDANLSAGFPLKSGDTTKKISVAFWQRPENVVTLGFAFSKWSTAAKRSFAIDKNGATLRVSFGYNSGNSGETWEVVTGLFVAGRDYHIGVAVDGVNKSATVRVYDKTNDTATTYTHTFTNEMYISDAELAIGRVSSGSYYDGLLDEIVVANDLLSVGEFDEIRQGVFGPEVFNFETACEAVSSPGSPNLAITRNLATDCAALSGNYITYGDGGAWGDGRTYGEMPGITLDIATGVVYDLTTSCEAVSATSSPNLKVVRLLTSSLAVESSAGSVLLAILRDFTSNINVATSTPEIVLLNLRAMQSTITAETETSAPLLTVLRLLTSSVEAQSTASIPNLLIQRLLSTVAEALSETSDINLTMGAIELVTTIAAQTQVPDIDLDVLRKLVTTSGVHSTTSTALVKILRDLITTISAESEASDIVLASLIRLLTTAISAESQTPAATLRIIRDLAAVIASHISTSTAALSLLRALTSAINAETSTSAVALKVLRELATVIACESETGDLYLINSLSSVIQAISETPDIAVPILRELAATIAVQSALSEITLMGGPELQWITTIPVLSETSIIELLLFFHESLRVQGKRFYGHIDFGDLRGHAVNWNPQSDLLDDALLWIAEEKEKAA